VPALLVLLVSTALLALVRVPRNSAAEFQRLAAITAPDEFNPLSFSQGARLRYEVPGVRFVITLIEWILIAATSTWYVFWEIRRTRVKRGDGMQDQDAVDKESGDRKMHEYQLLT
jgi:hypothetical protein